MRNACHIPLISLLSTSNWPCLGLSAFKVSTLSKKRLFFNIRLTESVFPYTILTTPDALSHKPSSISLNNKKAGDFKSHLLHISLANVVVSFLLCKFFVENLSIK